jgi:sugar phosphate isomerase/epimerase
MRFGVCCPPEQAGAALELGADFVELGAVGFKGAEEAWDPATFHGLPVEATNLFFPPEIRLFGEKRTDRRVLRSYITNTLERAASVGVRVMVVGSGRSREAPAPGLEVSRANNEFVSLVGEIQSEARRYRMTIAPESLNRTETNVGNDLGWLATALAGVGAGFTADSYHLLYEWDCGMRESEPESLAPSADYLRRAIPFPPAHVHFGDLSRWPPRSDDPMMRAFCGRLMELGYDARVSLECRWTDFQAELPEAIAAAKSLFQL